MQSPTDSSAQMHSATYRLPVEDTAFLLRDEMRAIRFAMAYSKADLLLRDLTTASREHGPAAFSSSLSAEDMVITDVILTAGLDIELFTIDTGRLHEQTLELLDRIRRRYRHDVRVYAPEAAAVAAYVGQHGRDAFYRSFELRREC